MEVLRKKVNLRHISNFYSTSLDLKGVCKMTGVKGHYVALMDPLAGVFHIIANMRAESDMKPLSDNYHLVAK